MPLFFFHSGACHTDLQSQFLLFQDFLLVWCLREINVAPEPGTKSLICIVSSCSSLCSEGHLAYHIYNADQTVLCLACPSLPGCRIIWEQAIADTAHILHSAL